MPGATAVAIGNTAGEGCCERQRDDARRNRTDVGDAKSVRERCARCTGRRFVNVPPVFLRASLLLTAALTVGGCGTSGSSSSPGSASGAPTPATTLFAASVTQVVVEVDYQTGAAPYTGATATFSDIWNLFKTNASRVFAMGAPKTVTLDAMASGEK